MASTTGTITEAVKRQNTIDGNPRYNITLTTDEGKKLNLHTADNSTVAYAYTLTNMEGQRVTIEHTQSGVIKAIETLD